MNTKQLGEFEQTVMLAILRLGPEAYGVSIAKVILDLTWRRVSPGALYTTLARLEQQGLLVSTEGAPTAERGGRAKRFYTVTKSGKRLLTEAQQGFQKLLNGLDLLGGQHG